MSSRLDDKQRRREERIKLERAEAAAEARRKRLGIGAGVLVLAAVLAAGAFALSSGGGGAAKKPSGGGDIANVKIPARQDNNLKSAARKAGCKFKEYAIQARGHTPPDVVTPVKYKTNPPTSGLHYPIPASDGQYGAGQAPPKEHYVHSLEHGRILFEYKPGSPKKLIGQMQSLFDERPSYVLLVENNTKMTEQVAATSWGRTLSCRKPNARMWDALRAFRDRFTLKGPEIITQPE